MKWTDNHTLVLRFAALDDTAENTAERTGISFHMVRSYRHQAAKMLGRHSLHGAVAEAIRQGILSLTDANHAGYIGQ